MEELDPKIIAAITAAVRAYIEETTFVEAEAVVAPVVEKINLWAIAGRQDLMLQRRLWQLRVY
ncbi:MAG: hypothetical protein JW950_13045 [Deltaproteobacteria bacterium]|nr:hypothetical protein [Deltaproteobacteria bacterium]